MGIMNTIKARTWIRFGRIALCGVGVSFAVHAQQPFVGEIMCGGRNFCPNGWAECSGQLMPISENETLFNLIGTTYGGDGQVTFALPDLRGRTMVHQGNSYVIAQTGGAEAVALTTAQMPAHSHTVMAHTGAERSASPAGGRIAGIAPSTTPAYASGQPSAMLAMLGTAAVRSTGGSQSHNNLQPYLTMKCCISLWGIYPSQY